MKELPVGEELNALLHEHLFGGCAHRSSRRQRYWSIPLAEPGGVTEGVMLVCNTCGEQVEPLPNYLDGNGMLKVVGKMRELGYYADVHFWQDGRAAVIFQRTTVMFPDGEAGDDDAPTATGQAALRALGVI